MRFDNIYTTLIIKCVVWLTKLMSGFGMLRRKLLKYPLDILNRAGMKLPRISVVVVNYNYSHYLTERLDSIINQTVGIYEIILVDDASNDSSLATIQHWMIKYNINIRIITNEYNSGSIFGQWKKGLSAATGDYIWIAEADDICDPDFLETLLPPMLEDVCINISYCESRQMDVNGSFYADNYEFYLKNVSETRWKSDRIADGEIEIKESLAILNSIPNISSALFRRKSLMSTMDQYASEISKFKIAADYALYVRLLLSGKMAYRRKNANIHRRHPESVIARCKRSELNQEIIAVQNWVMDRYKLTPTTIKKIQDYRVQMINEI